MTTTLFCSFCGKSQHEVTLLISARTVFICNECVDLCAEIVAGRAQCPMIRRLNAWSAAQAVQTVESAKANEREACARLAENVARLGELPAFAAGSLDYQLALVNAGRGIAEAIRRRRLRS